LLQLAQWSHEIFCPLQLSVQVLESIAEIIFLFGNQSGIPEPVNSSDEATHCRIPSLDRATNSRLDPFAFGGRLLGSRLKIQVIEHRLEALLERTILLQALSGPPYRVTDRRMTEIPNRVSDLP
jgi:hypothetical protein